MKKLFENWRRHLNEAEYEPGRAVADIDTGEERMSPEDLMRDEVQDLADKFGVEASVKTASDGKLAIMVSYQNGEVVAYNNAEEMYQDLARSYEMNEGAVPHSAHHVVKTMKKTGLSAKEALKSLTTDLSDEEAERWLERHKDQMDSAKKDLAGDQTLSEEEDREIMIPGYGSMMISQVRRKLAQMLQEAAEDAIKDPPQYSHLDGGVIQALHKALKENR